MSDVFCGGCLTGAPCVVACPGACPAVQAAFCPSCPIAAGSNVDLSNLPLTAPSGDPNLDGLTPSSNTTDNPPGAANCPSAPRGGGSGGGSSMSAGNSSKGGGLGLLPHQTQCKGVTALSSALNRFGTSISSLFGKVENQKTGLEQKTVNAITTPAFIILIVIVGGLMIMLAWGKKGA